MMALCEFAAPKLLGFEVVGPESKDCYETAVDHLHAPIGSHWSSRNTAEQHGLLSHELCIPYIVNRGTSVYSSQLHLLVVLSLRDVQRAYRSQSVFDQSNHL